MSVDVGDLHWAVGDAPARRRDLDHRLQPVEARASRCARWLLPILRFAASGGNRRRDLVCAAGRRRGVAEDVDAQRAHRPATPAARRASSRSSSQGDDSVVEHCRRRACNEAQTINKLQRDAPVGAGVAHLDAGDCASARAASIVAGRWQASARHSFSACRARRRVTEVVMGM